MSDPSPLPLSLPYPGPPRIIPPRPWISPLSLQVSCWSSPAQPSPVMPRPTLPRGCQSEACDLYASICCPCKEKQYDLSAQEGQEILMFLVRDRRGFMKLPAVAVKARLANIVPAKNKTHWDPASRDRLLAMVSDKPLSAITTHIGTVCLAKKQVRMAFMPPPPRLDNALCNVGLLFRWFRTVLCLWCCVTRAERKTCISTTGWCPTALQTSRWTGLETKCSRR